MNELLNPTTCVFIKEKQTEIIGKDILTQENDMKQEVETSIMKLPAKNSKDFLLLSEAVRKKKKKKKKQTRNKLSSKASGGVMANGHILFRLLSSRM